MTKENKPQGLEMDPTWTPASEVNRRLLWKWNPECGHWSLHGSSLLLPCSREFVGTSTGFSGPLAPSRGLS